MATLTTGPPLSYLCSCSTPANYWYRYQASLDGHLVHIALSLLFQFSGEYITSLSLFYPPLMSFTLQGRRLVQ